MTSFEGRGEPLRLLDLVCAVQDVATNDREVVAALQHLLDPPTDREGDKIAQAERIPRMQN